jgi:hypothetical protein
MPQNPHKNRARGPNPAGWYGEGKKNEVVILRLSDIEKTAFSDAAARRRMSLSDWLRAAGNNRLNDQLNQEEKEGRRKQKEPPPTPSFSDLRKRKKVGA